MQANSIVRKSYKCSNARSPTPHTTTGRGPAGKYPKRAVSNRPTFRVVVVNASQHSATSIAKLYTNTQILRENTKKNPSTKATTTCFLLHPNLPPPHTSSNAPIVCSSRNHSRRNQQHNRSSSNSWCRRCAAVRHVVGQTETVQQQHRGSGRTVATESSAHRPETRPTCDGVRHAAAVVVVRNSNIIICIGWRRSSCCSSRPFGLHHVGRRVAAPIRCGVGGQCVRQFPCNRDG